MAIDHNTITVGTTPTLIYTAHSGTPPQRVYITNHDNAAVYVGDPTVSISGPNWGFTIVKDGNYDFEINAGEQLYAVSATSAQVTVLVFGA